MTWVVKTCRSVLSRYLGMVLTSDNNHNQEKVKIYFYFSPTKQARRERESIRIVYFKVINFFYVQNDEMGGFNFVYNYKL